MAEQGYERSLGHWVKRFYLLSVREVEALLRPHGLGRTQWYVLYHVDLAGQISQRDLQSILDVESATLTALVGALVQKGWLAQAPSAADRRTKVLTLTQAGSAHFRSVPNPIPLAQRRALAGLAPEDIDRAREVLERAVRNLEEGTSS